MSGASPSREMPAGRGERMRSARLARPALDITLAALFLLQMGYIYLPLGAHEALGAALGVAAFVHVLQHRAWFRSLVRGRWTAVRVLRAAGVFAALSCMAVLVASGVALSGVLPASTSSWAQEAHLAASHAALLAFGFHIGASVARGSARSRDGNVLRTLALCSWLLWSVYGAYAFVRLGVIGYLTGAMPFFAADDTVPFALAVFDYASITAAAAFARFLMSMFCHLERRRRSTGAARGKVRGKRKKTC